MIEPWKPFVALSILAAIAFGLAREAVADSLPVVSIGVGAMPIDPSAEAFYAQDEGFFKQAGLDVKLTVLNNGAGLLAAAAAGTLDIGFGSPSPVIQAHQRGIPVRFFAPAAVYAGPPANSVLVVAKDSPIHTGADLNGKIVGVSGLRDLTFFSTEAWIEQNGGDPSTVQFIEIPYAEIGAAIEQKRIAAGAVIEPFITTANATRELANLNAAVGKQYLLAGWFTTDHWMQQHPDIARRFVAVMQRTARWANTHHKESAAILARYSAVDPAVAARMQRSRYDEQAGVSPQLVQPILDLLQKYGKLPPLAATDLVSPPAL